MKSTAIPRSGTHRALIRAFRSIQDKEALAWAILDGKSESIVSNAISASANRGVKARLAHSEYSKGRVDLVLLKSGKPSMLYEAKAGYTTDFQPKRIGRGDKYLGPCVSKDLVKLARVRRKHPKHFACVQGHAALFYLYEISNRSRQIKYGRKPAVNRSCALAGLTGLAKRGNLVKRVTIDCGHADSAKVKIHLCIFEPKF